MPIRINFTKTFNKLSRNYGDAIASKLIRAAVRWGAMPVEYIGFLDQKKRDTRNGTAHKQARANFSGDIILKNMVHRRFEGKCYMCKGSQSLEVHHIKPIKTHPHLAKELLNLVLLCRKCHRNPQVIHRIK